MKSLSTAQQTAIGSSHVVTAWLIELATSPAVRITTAGMDLQWNGYTWAGSGLLLNVSQVIETTSVEATSLTVELSGVPTSLLALAAGSNTQGKVCSVWVAWFDPDTGAMIGEPSTEAKGTVDTPAIVLNGETATVSITVETAMADFARPNVRRFTDADHQSRYPGDKFFEYVTQMKERVFAFPSREAQF